MASHRKPRQRVLTATAPRKGVDERAGPHFVMSCRTVQLDPLLRDCPRRLFIGSTSDLWATLFVEGYEIRHVAPWLIRSCGF